MANSFIRMYGNGLLASFPLARIISHRTVSYVSALHGVGVKDTSSPLCTETTSGRGASATGSTPAPPQPQAAKKSNQKASASVVETSANDRRSARRRAAGVAFLLRKAASFSAPCPSPEAEVSIPAASTKAAAAGCVRSAAEGKETGETGLCENNHVQCGWAQEGITEYRAWLGRTILRTFAEEAVHVCIKSKRNKVKGLPCFRSQIARIKK